MILHIENPKESTKIIIIIIIRLRNEFSKVAE